MISKELRDHLLSWHGVPEAKTFVDNMDEFAFHVRKAHEGSMNQDYIEQQWASMLDHVWEKGLQASFTDIGINRFTVTVVDGEFQRTDYVLTYGIPGEYIIDGYVASINMIALLRRFSHNFN